MSEDERTATNLQIVEELLRIAARASKAIARVYATDFAVDYKAAHDPVTVADREANGIICEELAKAFPGVPVVAEESDPATYAGWRDASSVFFVDPLDGTRDFVKKNGEFAVMIGLAENGRAKLGVIHAPATDRRWAGGDGIAAFEQLADGTRRPLGVSQIATMAAARLVASRSRPSEELVEVAEHLGVGNVSPLGSAGIKAVAIASGEAELYAHLGNAGWRWDTCAPEAIVRAAGGTTTDAYGDPIDYRAPSLLNSSGLLMSNGHLHEPLLTALARVRAERKGNSG
ncbi:3'(2'),5'-bisphosphate nucleotidase CysQ [Pendulispora albinea]|uniref:3'(2'),5-bisphosphonucleoside 3'(2')-phosphohydrolase n=1 Tax=Pendulispora albinea TaxID=2741071 RepID=A0ABZ2M0I9_9BACT